MNKRDFIKNLTGAGLGAAALATLPASSTKFNAATSAKTDLALRRQQMFANVPLMTHEGKVVRFL